MKKILISVFSGALILLFSTFSLAQEHKKSSWYIGFGLGTGDGAWEVNGEEVTFNEWFEGVSTSPRVTFNIGIGGIVNPKLHVGFEGSGIRQEGDGEIYGYGVEGNVQINNYLAALTYFPNGEGFFLKAGAGLSSIRYEISTSIYSSVVSVSESYSGTALLGGLGYAFWVGKHFNLCINADYSVQNYTDDEAPDTSHFWNLYLSFYWF